MTDNKGFDDWVDMWDKAQNDGSFVNAPKPPEKTNGSFFGLQSNGPGGDLPPEEADTKYWNQVYARSNNAGDAPDIGGYEQIMHEQKKPQKKVQPRKLEKKKKVQPRKVEKKKKFQPLAESREDAKVAKAQLKSPNPIYSYSVGKDQDSHVTPNWTDGEGLVELHDMKLKLHRLEGKLNAMIGTSKPDRQIRQLESELRKLRDRLDELSDSLHGGYSAETKD